MINKIVNTFYEASKRNKMVNSFYYEIPSKILGNGDDYYPMVLLEEPLRLNGDVTAPTQRVTANISVMTNERNSKIVNQEKCERILYQLVAYVNRYSSDYFAIEDVDVLTLSRYNDDSTDGVRATLTIVTGTTYNECIEDDFDENKEFKNDTVMPDIYVDDAESCNTGYQFKLPNIRLN